MKKQNKLRLNPEELWPRLQDVKLPEKLYTSAPRAKAALMQSVVTPNVDLM